LRDLGEVCAESRQQVAGLVEQAEACFARLCVSNNEFSIERGALDASLATSIDRIKAVMEQVWSTFQLIFFLIVIDCDFLFGDFWIGHLTF
jgi:hypothetical protein